MRDKKIPKLLELYRTLGYLTAKLDAVKRQIAFLEKNEDPDARIEDEESEEPSHEG